MSAASPLYESIDPRMERLLYSYLIIKTCTDSSRALSPLMQEALFQSAVISYYAALNNKQDQLSLCADKSAKRLFKKYRKLRNKSMAHIGDIEKPKPVTREWVATPSLSSDIADTTNVKHGLYLEITRFPSTEYKDLKQLIAMTYAHFKDKWVADTQTAGSV